MANSLEEDLAAEARIKQLRFDRGVDDAKAGDPPTEASEEYNLGYQSICKAVVPHRKRHEFEYTETRSYLLDKIETVQDIEAFKMLESPAETQQTKCVTADFYERMALDYAHGEYKEFYNNAFADGFRKLEFSWDSLDVDYLNWYTCGYFARELYDDIKHENNKAKRRTRDRKRRKSASKKVAVISWSDTYDYSDWYS